VAKPPTEAVLRAQKEAKQKKFLLLLIPLFIILLAWQGPKTYKALSGGSGAAPPPVLVTTTPTTPPGSVAQPNTDGSSSLPDTDAQPELLDGQLLSFSRFFGRDPFAPAGSSGGPAAASSSAATIQVNGASEDLGIGDSFPANDPTFKLVSVSTQAANIGLVSGSFSNGASTISINVGETLVLVADDGARYAIKLVSVASA
jgi:hypothetical protein